eukprot:6188429-Pleurochrysis_carterae.AAC.1
MGRSKAINPVVPASRRGGSIMGQTRLSSYIKAAPYRDSASMLSRAARQGSQCDMLTSSPALTGVVEC